MTILVGGFTVSYVVSSGVLYDLYQYCMPMIVREAYALSTWEMWQAANIPTQNGNCDSIIIQRMEAMKELPARSVS
jgi:hypothetical protein